MLNPIYFRYRNLRRAMIALSFAVGTIFATCQTFTCEGYLEIKKIQKKPAVGVPVLERHVDFRAEIDLPNGLFSYFDLSRPPRSASTGGDFLLDRMAVVDRKSNTTNGDIFQASLSMEGYPIDWEWDQRFVWLAYAGRDFLRSRDGAQVILPNGDARYEAHVVSCRARMQWRSPNDICPSTIEFQHDVKLFANAPSFLKLKLPGKGLDQREEDYQLLQQRLTNGQVMARFRVANWTNLASTGIPQSSVLEVFNSVGKLSRVYECTTSSVKALEQTVQLVSAPPGATIVDKRVRDVQKGINYVSYTVSNGIIPSLKDSSLKTLVSGNVSRDMHLRPPNLKRTRATFIGLILLVFAAPLIGVIIAKRLKRIS